MKKSSVGFPFNYELTGGEINVKAFHQILTRDWRISIKEEKTDDQGMDKILDDNLVAFRLPAEDARAFRAHGFVLLKNVNNVLGNTGARNARCAFNS